MPSNWIKRVFSDGDNSEGEISIKVPRKDFGREMSQKAIELREILNAKDGALSEDEAEERSAEFYLWVFENCPIRLKGDWDGIEFEPGQSIKASVQEEFAEEYYKHAVRMGQEVFLHIKQPVKGHDPNELLTNNQFLGLIAKCLLETKSPEDFAEKVLKMVDMLVETNARIGQDNVRIKEQLAAIKLNEADAAGNPTPTET